MTGAGLLLLATAIASRALADGTVFQDETVRMSVPSSWSVTGEAGEYSLEAGSDVASLLLLPPDPDQSLEVRLAEIEEQFLSTGIIRLETSEERPGIDPSEEGVSYRRYRLVSGPAKDPTSILLHQYSFVRSAVRILLQVETPPRGGGQERLFDAIHRSLVVRRAPDPFEADIDPFAEPDTLPGSPGSPGSPDSMAAPDSSRAPDASGAPADSTGR
ncbi:MAG: hypothetical protein U0167_08175 [bacterium]